METAGSTEGAGPSTVSYPTAPVYAFDAAPRTVLSLNASAAESEVEGNFFRSARWCPDGTAVSTTSEDRVLRVFDTPGDLDPDFPPEYRSFSQPDSIHATAWYPSASLNQPQTFCFAASIRDTPVRLIDATDGRIRATYPIIDHRERFIAPYAMAFSPDASRLYCGCENAIEVLDIATPGPGGSERMKTTATKLDKVGQKGIISALAFSTDYSGLFAAGSFGGSVSLYQEDHDGSVGHLDGIVGGGVTQLQFHPLSPSHLFVASRRSDVIQMYDRRNPVEAIGQLPRTGDTNQRLFFDLDPWGRYIATGDENGYARVWDIATAFDEDGQATTPLLETQVAKDAIGSIQFHPYKPYLMGVSGSRQQPVAIQSDDSDTDSASEQSESDDDASASSVFEILPRSMTAVPSRGPKRVTPVDEALRIWAFP